MSMFNVVQNSWSMRISYTFVHRSFVSIGPVPLYGTKPAEFPQCGSESSDTHTHTHTSRNLPPIMPEFCWGGSKMATVSSER